MRYLLLLMVVSLPAYAGVRYQATSDLIEPAIASPTHINTLPAAVEVMPVVVRGPTPTMPVAAKAISTTVKAVAVTASPTVLQPEMVAAEQCVAGMRVLTQLALVGYESNPNKSFMRVAAAAAIAEPYAANGVIPNLKALQSAIDDLPYNGAGVREINQAYGITKTACSGIVKGPQTPVK